MYIFTMLRQKLFLPGSKVRLFPMYFKYKYQSEYNRKAK